MDLRAFANKMHKREADLRKNVDAVKRQVAISAATTVISETPVDTAKSVSNWRIYFGNEAGGVVTPPLIPGSKGSTRQENVRMAIQRAIADIQAGDASKDIRIGNSVEYILDLNRGSSTQAPAGFVEAAGLVARRALKNAKVIKV